METKKTIETSSENNEEKKVAEAPKKVEAPKKTADKQPKSDSKETDKVQSERLQTESALGGDAAKDFAFPNFEFKSVEEQRRMNVSELRNYADDLKELCLRGY